VVPVAEDGSPSLEQPPLAWISLEDRAAGRTNVQFVIASDAPERDALAGALLDWAVEVGGSFARARGVAETQLDIDIHELDTDRARLLTAAGYRTARSGLTWVRPVPAGRPPALPARPGGTRVGPCTATDPGSPSPRTCAPCTGCWRSPSRTTGAPTGSPSPSSSSASPRRPGRPAGTSGGSPRSSARTAGFRPAAWWRCRPRRRRPTARAPISSTWVCTAAPAATGSPRRCCAPRSPTPPS